MKRDHYVNCATYCTQVLSKVPVYERCRGCARAAFTAIPAECCTKADPKKKLKGLFDVRWRTELLVGQPESSNDLQRPNPKVMSEREFLPNIVHLVLVWASAQRVAANTQQIRRRRDCRGQALIGNTWFWRVLVHLNPEEQ